MDTGAFGRAQFRPDVVVAKNDRVITRFCNFVGVAELGSVTFFRMVTRAGDDLRWAGSGHQQEIEHVSNAGATQVRVAKTHDRIVGVVVSRGPVPTFVVRIRAKLHRAEGHRGTGISMSAGADCDLHKFR